MNILTGSQNDDSRLDLAVAYRDGNSNTILWLSVCIKTLVSIFVIVALSADTYGSSHRQRETTWFELSTVSSARAVTTEPVQAQFQAQCNPRTGLSAPLGLCTSASPCRHQKGQFVISSIDRPVCTTVNPRQPVFRDGSPRAWIDGSGTPRYACIFQPAGASRESPRPLVLWLHGGLGAADDVYNYTLLRQKAAFFDLSGDPSRPGFILVSIQGRNIHYPTGLPPGSREGPHHDIYFRDLRTNTANPDLQYYDHLVDAFVAEGVVDPQRIYVMGWSNGGFMAQMYAISRFVTPTPEGNHVAAAAVFGAADPFNNTTVDQRPSCQLNPYPPSQVRIYLIHRSCDAACACSPAQMAQFSTPPGYNLLDWISALKNEVRNPNIVFHLIDDNGKPTESCDDGIRCKLWWGRRRGLINHNRWPDGVADGGGRDWEVGMLEFLKRSPHP
jgi:pimeloyl-ACP methyl ester carboxylesterase